MTRAQLKKYFYLWLGSVVVVGAAGGDVWLSARNPQGPILLALLVPRRAVDGGFGAVDGGASLTPHVHRLLPHQVSLLARRPGRQFADSGAIIQSQFIVHCNGKGIYFLLFTLCTILHKDLHLPEIGPTPEDYPPLIV